MIERPKVEKPRIQEWANDDDELSKLLTHLESKVLNTSNWEVFHPMKNKYIKFDEMLKSLQERKYPTLWDLESIKGFVMYLPEKMNIINKELFTVMKRFSLNLQERLNYIQSVDEYIDHLEAQLDELKKDLKVKENETKIDEYLPELDQLKSQVEFLMQKIKEPKHIEEHQEEDPEPEVDEHKQKLRSVINGGE